MPRLSVRKLWAAKVNGSLKAASSSLAPSILRAPYEGRILGIDPSLRGTGLAVVEFHRGRSPVLLHSRTIHVPANRTMPQALAAIHQSVTELVTHYAFTHVALEQTIYVQNFQTAQILGAARGAAIAAVALHDLPIFEYAPLRVKQAVVGAGRASKEQMARTIMALMGHSNTLGFDEADAAGVALCHAFTWRPEPD